MVENGFGPSRLKATEEGVKISAYNLISYFFVKGTRIYLVLKLLEGLKSINIGPGLLMRQLKFTPGFKNQGFRVS